MSYLDFVRENASVVTDSIFDLSSAVPYSQFPSNVDTDAFLSDVSGNWAHIYGSKVGSQFIRQYTIETSESDNSMPTFGGSLAIHSTVGATNLNKLTTGRAGVLIIGQSNAVCQNLDNDPTLDFTNGNVTEWHNNQYILAQDPLNHDLVAPQGSDSVGFGPHLAKTMLRNGYGHVTLIAQAHGSTSFSTGFWRRGGQGYDNARSETASFLNDSPDNYLDRIILALGEDDSAAAVSQAQYSAYQQELFSNLKADLASDTGRDLSRVPIVSLGMNFKYLELFGANGAAVEAAIADDVNNIPYYEYLQVSPWATIVSETVPPLNYHTDAASCRRIGNIELEPATKRARGNEVEEVGGPTVLLATAPSLALSGSSAQIVTTGGPEVLSLEASAPSLALSGSLAEIVTTAASATPLTDALNVDAQLRSAVGITISGSGISQWDDQSGNGNHGVQTVDANRLSAIQQGTDDQFIELPGSLLEQSTGFTLMWNLTPTDLANGQLMTTIGGGTFMSSTGLTRVRQTGNGNNDVTHTLSAGTSNWIAIVWDPTTPSVRLYQGQVGLPGSLIDEVNPASASNVVNPEDKIKIGAIDFISLGSPALTVHNIIVKTAPLSLSDLDDIASEF